MTLQSAVVSEGSFEQVLVLQWRCSAVVSEGFRLNLWKQVASLRQPSPVALRNHSVCAGCAVKLARDSEHRLDGSADTGFRTSFCVALALFRLFLGLFAAKTLHC